MASPFKAALLRHAAAAMIISATLSLVACAPQSNDAAVKDGLEKLRAALASIDGVENARVGGGYDGSPNRRHLLVYLYLNDLSAAAVTPIVEEALATAWKFDAFIPVGYSIQVWPAPIPSPPANADSMFDLTLIQPALGLTGGYVVNNQLFLTDRDLEAKFGAKNLPE